MILLAMMTGSDYTEGLENVGPVTAMEILAEFPGNGMEPLEKFKSWWEECQSQAIKPGNQTRSKLRKLEIPKSFPTLRVYNAYMAPVVDHSKETFSWAVPNFVAVRDFASEKFGWSLTKVDEIVKPVIRKMASSSYQSRIDNFFLGARNKLPDRGNLKSSKRVQGAIEKVLGKQSSMVGAGNSRHSSPVKGKRKRDGEIEDKPTSSKKVKDPIAVKRPLANDEDEKKTAKERAIDIFKRVKKRGKNDQRLFRSTEKFCRNIIYPNLKVNDVLFDTYFFPYAITITWLQKKRSSGK